MASDPLDSRADPAPNAVFATTHWSVVLKAGEVPGDESARALDSLCRGYWYPLYAYIRRLGHSPHDAQDLTQSYFAYLLEKRLLTKADPESGRFRSFLLGSLKHFMANEWRKQHAQKRDARQTISFDAADAETRYAIEPDRRVQSATHLRAGLGCRRPRPGHEPARKRVHHASRKQGGGGGGGGALHIS
jgi:RNA polymerase sigma factor (sigma-70 family)